MNLEFFLSVLILGHVNGDYDMASPVVTYYGTWGEWNLCPRQNGLPTFVTGMQLQYTRREEQVPPDGNEEPDADDDEGLIDIILSCEQSSVAIGKERSFISSNNSSMEIQADELTKCEGFAVGFQLMSDVPQVALDNTGANNLRLFCSGLAESFPQYVEGYGSYNGDWTPAQLCKSRQALCGIQTQTQTKFSLDKTGINNIRMRCCDMPSPAATCTPYERWELIQQCNNTLGKMPSQCTFNRLVGIGRGMNFETVKGRKSYLKEFEDNEDLGFKADRGEFWLMHDLSHNFEDNLKDSEEAPYEWGEPNLEVWNEETSVATTYDVKEGYTAEIYQVVGICSYFSVRTPMITRIDVQRQWDE